MKVLCVTLNPAIDLTVSLDVLNLGEVNRAHTQQTDAAGKGLNSAQILADLGADALAAGFLGAENDALFRQLFADRATERTKNPKLGALGDEFMRVAGATRTNIKLVDGAGTGVRTTDVNGAGFQISADDTARLSQHLCALASQADAVLVAGSLPKGFALNDFKGLFSKPG
ncbi:Tagatose-6-phosphate kinase [Moraxella caviae]|uniref:PfkB family carbohydrate kinase n=1 Tax=Moraxella caviae TaxID=34060 RepID=UPI00101B3E8D|nr:PfkB family carbohydrate kinase [Moraxella caviae]VEW12722.1 Tagatose-6-phosphate kinase [Moraxella caviae]